MAYDLYLFDFDGVLFNTNRIKSEAFRQTLRCYPQQAVDDFIRYHEANGGVSRHIKFAHFFEVILGKTDSRPEQQKALERFANIGACLMASAKPMEGVPQILAGMQHAGIPCAICSGGSRDEIKALLQRNQLDNRFIEIWGNEQSKAEHAAQHIVPRFTRVLFFGDARYDMEVAEQFGFDFVFVSSLSDWPEGCKEAIVRGHKCVHDFKDCREILGELD